jgi:type VI secretion system protein ImpH
MRQPTPQFIEASTTTIERTADTTARKPAPERARRAAEPVRAERDPLQTFLDRIKVAPHQFDFFALLRRLDALQVQHPRYGSGLRPLHEPLRLGQDTELDFAPTALSSLSHNRNGIARLGTRFFGLLGPQGPMPLYVTEYVRDRLRNGNDAAPARFLDLFHHRMLALFYRAWAEAQPVVQHDRPAQDRFAAWLGSSSGVWVNQPDAGSSALPVVERLPQNAQLFHAGFFGSRSRHPEGLCKILSSHIDAPVMLQQYVAQRIRICDDDRKPLRSTGDSLATPGPRANALGVNATAGRYVWDRQFKFRLEIGPLSFARFSALLPDRAAWPHLRDWVDRYVGRDCSWDAELALDPLDLPAPRLGRQVRLGLTCWIGRHAASRGDTRLRIRPDAIIRSRFARTVP